VQAPELQHDKEQEKDDRTTRAEEVLSVVPDAYDSSRDQMTIDGLVIADLLTD
jgi:hypothetical protein